MGESGVDLFFVISGFIMALVCRPATKPLTFLTLRFWRIYPLWWLVTLATIVVHSVPTWSSVTSSMLLWPSKMPIVFQGWTLQIEVFFYALIAVGLWCMPKRVMPLVSAGLCALAIAGLIFMPAPRVLTTYTSTMLLEFVAGIALHRFWMRKIVPSTRLSVVLIGIVAGALAVQLPLPRPDDHWRVIYWGIPYTVLMWAALGLETAGRIPHWSAARLLGDASYSLYLVHNLILPLFRPWAWGLPAPLLIVAMLLVTEAVSVLLSVAVERNLVCFGHKLAGSLDAAQRAGWWRRRPRSASADL